MSLSSAIQRRIYTPETDSLKQWQERSFTFVLASISIAALPPLFISVPQAIKDGMWVNLASYVIGYLLCLSLIFAKKIPFRLRAWTGILVFLGVGSLAILTLGPVGSGRIWLFTTSVFATLTLGIRAGIIILLAQLGILTLFGYLLTSMPGRWADVVDFTLNIWVITSVTFAFLSVVSILAMGSLIKGLSLALERSRESRKQLLNTTNQLNEKIEAHRQSEISRRESEARWLFALEGAGDGVWDWDVQSKKVFFSARWKKMLGFDDHEIGTEIDEWLGRIHPEDQETVHKEINCILYEQADNFQNRYRIRRKDQSFLWVLDRGKVMTRNKEGNPLRIIGTRSDLTFIKEMEDQKMAYEMRLQQSQKMEAIGTLAGGIAHDFNNILAAILGYAEMAKDDCQPGSTISKDLNEVLEAANRAKSLVRQILAFSRQDDTERMLLQPASIIKETITMLRPSLPTTIEITQDIDAVTGLVFVDPTQLNQILMNLCTNAFHAMEDTGGKLDISLKEVTLCNEDLVNQPGATGGNFIQLSIGDSGTGIAPTVKDKIFDPYFTTKEITKGTGMGLSMVHGIVKKYGGFISLYSELGEGTVFHVFLPTVEKEVLTEDEVNDQIPIGRERILFVDDEEILAKMGKTMLERLGYHVTVRNNSLEALETFQNQPDKFDIVITDQTMPGMTGSDLSRRVQQIRPDIPIILCTGYSTIISEEKAKSIGIKEFALKPLAKKDIAKLIRKVLDNP